MSGSRRALRVTNGGLAAAAGSWLEIVRDALRPEFEVDVYFPQPGEPILFGSACSVDGCRCRGTSRPEPDRNRFLCHTHTACWREAGRPGLDSWLSAGVRLIAPGGIRLSRRCGAEGCRRSRATRWWCRSHSTRWYRAGRPPIDAWARVAGPVACGESECAVVGCGFAPMPGRRLCDAHWASLIGRQRYRNGQAVEVDQFIASLVDAERRQMPHYDFAALREPLRSEFRFAIQQRLDENQHSVSYLAVASAARWAAGLPVSSLLEREDGWWAAAREQRWGAGGLAQLSFVRYARARLSRLHDRTRHADPFAADVWMVDQLGIPGYEYQRPRSISFAGFEPEWFKELVKRWARWRLQAGTMTPGSVASIVPQIKKFCDFLDDSGERLDRPQNVTRELLERYRAHITSAGYSPAYRTSVLVSLRVLLDDARFNGWEPGLAWTATYFRGELPRGPESLPRFIDEFVMGQIERPENIARITDLTIRTAVSVLIKTGLRSVDVCRLQFEPIVHDAAGAPVLLYYNHKLKREAALPVDDALVAAIRAQQATVLVRFPHGCPWLLPSARGNRSGDVSLTVHTLRKRMHAWLAAGEVRDAHGRAVKVTPHQFRHTLATRMINNEVPVTVIRRLLDHNSTAMTDVYARISDETLKREFEKFNNRVNINGEVIPIDPAGLMNEAAWMKERLARAKQTLPNGYCGLPLQQSCPHPNACLTCGHFLTTEGFLPIHRDQLAKTERLIDQAKLEGSDRKREMNENVRLNLVRIIEGLESISDNQRDEGADAA